MHCGRIASGQFAILDARERPSMFPAPKVDHKRSLNDQWISARLPAALQVEAPAMRRALIQGQSTLIQRVDLANLCGGGRGERSVGIAPGIGQNLHFLIDAAKTAVVRISQGPVAMYK